MNDFCKCGKVATVNPVWHAWRVNWKDQPKSIREFLKYDRICEKCKTKIKSKLRSMGA